MNHKVRLKACLKKNLIKIPCNNTEFEYRISKNNERRDILIKPKNNSHPEYLSVILLDSILIYPKSYCSNKYYPQILLKKCIYTKKKKNRLIRQICLLIIIKYFLGAILKTRCR